MQFMVNGSRTPISTAPDLRAHLADMQQVHEVWLDVSEDGPALCMLVNGDRAFLMYLRDGNGDPGFSSRSPHYAGSADAVEEFELSNGQMDEYPLAWTIPLSEALAACEYFVETGGDRSPNITWHDDSSGDEH